MVTVITKTIGASGRDYTTPTLAEADVGNIGTSTDLVTNDEAIVFEIDAGTYTQATAYNSPLTTDATRNVTYKPATGAEHGGVKTAGVILEHVNNQDGKIQDDFQVMQGLVFVVDSSPSGKQGPRAQADGVVFRECISSFLGTSRDAMSVRNGGTSSNPARIENCVIEGDSTFGYRHPLLIEATSSSGANALVVNTTIRQSGSDVAIALRSSNASYTVALECVNCLVIGTEVYDTNGSGIFSFTGSNNFGPGTNAFPTLTQGSPYPVTATTSTSPGAGDWLIYRSATFQLVDDADNDVTGGGVGPASNSDVPTIGLTGQARSGSTTQPGAFATLFSLAPTGAPTLVTKTVGPTGRDYATPALAEADVTNIATTEFTGTDLVTNNGRIVFEIDAGTYSNLAVSSTLTTDATRNVTYRPAAGSEHGASLSAGVILEASVNVLNVQDDHTLVEGLVAKGSGSYALVVSADGVTCRNLVLANTNQHVTIFQNGTAGSPVRVENCVAHATNGYGFYVFGTSTAAHCHIINCTCIYSYTTYGIRNYGSAANLTLVNYMGLHTSGAAYQAVSSPTITGTNNFAIETGTLPVAVRGAPYPITATTSLDPGFGHYAIYDADTGKLLNEPENTVWNRGIGPSADSKVPTTDINGFPRSGDTANPGAFARFESLTQTVVPVPRFSTYKRPSTQVFNHHRRIACVFPDDSLAGVSNTFAVGVAARGFIGPISRDCIVFFVYYTTNGAGAQTTLRLEVARMLGQYDADTVASAQPIARIQKQAAGESIPAGFDFPGNSHTVALKVQTFAGATTPESAAEYTAYIDGTAVTFDTFFEDATQDGTSKVVTHPAPAVGTTQGRSESFFWYATNERLDSLGFANYTLPQWSAWEHLAVDADPIFSGDGQSITVEGEGTGTVNLSTALGEVDWTIDVAYELPRFDVPFASGHRYTSPRFGTARRLITANATNIDKATMDALVRFHAARDGIQDPFLFDFPIPASISSETLDTITVQFADTAGLLYERRAENTYSVQLNMIELL